MRNLKTVRMAVVLSLVAGLLIGWLVIGWWAWPVQWVGATADDLSAEGRDQYLDLVAETWARDRDPVELAERLAAFTGESQPALMKDVETRATSSFRGTENILVLGQDQRPGWESWRTDSIMVLVLDYDRSQVGVISVPRDLWVDIPGYGQQRINAVDYIGEEMKYEGGGPALVSRVISDTIGIPTQHYVRIHLNGLVKLVDALGGVTIHLDCPLYERTPKESDPRGYEEFNLPAGEVPLTGDEARKFATYRYGSNDFSRTRRQQQLIWAIRNRALEGDVIGQLPQLWSALSDLYTTDLTLIDAVRLARFGAGLEPARVHGMTFSADVIKEIVTGDGEWVLGIGDPAALQAELQQLFLDRPLEARGRIAADEECPPPPE